MAELNTEFAQLGQDFARVRPNKFAMFQLEIAKMISWNVVKCCLVRKSADIATNIDF